uniref:Cupin-like domain-containing protein n=1 Tax=viral metagenome TaxID=1070528 RepID=A0A6C0JZ22_9ZZZZ
MIVQIFLFICICFLIAVCFYKQHRSTIELLQVEYAGSQDTLKDLAQERQPLIIRGTPIPTSITIDKLSKINRLDGFPLADSKAVLMNYRTTPDKTLPEYQQSGLPLLTSEQSMKLAKELALDTWVNHTLQDMINDMAGIFTVAHRNTIKVILGGKGMERALSIYTIIMPVEGKYVLSIVNKKSETFLPSNWRHRYARTLTINDSPMVGEIQYIDVILRPGTLICIPSHCIYNLEPDNSAEFHSSLLIEVDSPISNFTKFLEDL